MSYNLFLDVKRHPVKSYNGYLNTLEDCFKEDYINLNWEIVRTYNDFCNIISTKGLPNRISFDHDIAVGGNRLREMAHKLLIWNLQVIANFILQTQQAK